MACASFVSPIEIFAANEVVNWPPFRPDTWASPWRLGHMPEHVLMSEIEIITAGGRRRRWTAAEKLRIVEERRVVSLLVV
jgi:transposase